MILTLSLKSLFRRRSRTLLALTGIAVSAALLLDMTMLASGLTESFGELTARQGYALRVTPRGTLPLDSEAGIRDGESLQKRLESVEGVRAVAPVLGAQLYLVRGDSATESLFIVAGHSRGQALYEVSERSAPRGAELL